ncbi:MAG: hypothetical protein ACFFFD_03395 [Promethearchaeota archaeon]
MSVEWDYPEPREGLAGQWDTFIGPGATRAESALMLGFGLAAGILLLVYQYIDGLGHLAANRGCVIDLRPGWRSGFELYICHQTLVS